MVLNNFILCIFTKLTFRHSRQVYWTRILIHLYVMYKDLIKKRCIIITICFFLICIDNIVLFISILILNQEFICILVVLYVYIWVQWTQLVIIVQSFVLFCFCSRRVNSLYYFILLTEKQPLKLRTYIDL